MRPASGARVPGAVAVFLAFAFAYFFSALLRAVTATLAPVFSAEMGLQAADLGLLAGAYFLGFAALQLPMGSALDHHGPRRTQLALMSVAVIGCCAFAMASNLPALFAARLLIGAGVGACLMAPLTCYRRLYSPTGQMRANSWMLMTGSLGMLASTLPVQWLLPALGWRGLFWMLAVLLMLSMLGVAVFAPRDPPAVHSAKQAANYGAIVRQPAFRSLAPLAFMIYGGMVSVQTLWAGPWLTRLSGWTPGEAAQGLFGINLAMLLAFLGWGLAMPRLARHGIDAYRLVRWGVPPALVLLAVIIWLGGRADAWLWALWCVACTVVALSQPAVGAAFPAQQAGRALSAFNLVIFLGVFAVQWGVGLLVDALRAWGLAEEAAFQVSFAIFDLLAVVAYAKFWVDTRRGVDNRA